jgi:ABC-type transporter Mla maintaining outer membrane lipid asymmetry permease subunit MlaE
VAVQVGDAAFQIAGEMRRLCLFSGALAISLVRGIARRRMRWKEVLRLIETSGVDAAPIVALISSLIGLIMAFLGALQLVKSAPAYAADGVALAMVRAGPVMTAVLVPAAPAAVSRGAGVDGRRPGGRPVVMGFDPVSYWPYRACCGRDRDALSGDAWSLAE